MPHCEISLATLDAKLTSLTEDVKRCETLLSGNGNPERGVIVRLDRVEQMLATQKRFTWAFLTVIAFPWVYEIIKRFM